MEEIEEPTKEELSDRSTIFTKIYEEFENSAIEGAILLINGQLPFHINSSEREKQVSIYNKTFFSIAS
jgi:hypothetical protein